MNKILQYLSWVTIISALGIMVLVGFWLLYPYKIITFSDDKFPIMNENKTVKQGESIVYRAKYCKFIAVPSETTRSFVDGIIYTTPSVGSNKVVGCGDNLVFVEVPKTIPAGKYTIQMLYRFRINPLRTIDIIKITELFLIVK
jgi:hypothetical protein